MSLFYKRLSSANSIEQSLACGLVCSKVDVGVEQNIPYVLEQSQTRCLVCSLIDFCLEKTAS